jgi:hypothetical protein
MTRVPFAIDRDGVGFPLNRVTAIWVDGLEVVALTRHGRQHRLGPTDTVGDAVRLRDRLMIQCGK